MKRIIEKYSRLSVQAKAALWFALCSVLQKGIAFLTVPVFTRLLTAEEYGTYSLYLSWLGVLTIITSLYLYNGVLNNAMVRFEHDRDRCISAMQGLTVTVTAAVFVLWVIFRDRWTAFSGLAPVLMVLMFAEMLVTPALSYWSGRQRFEYRYKRLVAITLAKSLANPLLGLLAVKLSSGDGATARVAAAVAVEVLFCGAVAAYQFARGRCFFHRKYWKYALSMGIPLLPHYLSSMVLSQGDRIMIEKLAGRSQVAFYSVACNTGMVVQVLTNAIGSAFTPWIYQRLKAGDCKGMARRINGLLFLTACGIFVLMLCGPELMLLFGSEEYAGSEYVVPPVAASVFFIFLYNLLAVPQFYHQKTQYMLLSSLCAAAANIALNYIFIRPFGYVAAAYTTLACYVLYSLGHYFVSVSILEAHSPGTAAQMFDRRMILALSAAVIAAGSLCGLLFGVPVVRYILIAGLAVCAFPFRSKIKTLVLGS